MPTWQRLAERLQQRAHAVLEQVRARRVEGRTADISDPAPLQDRAAAIKGPMAFGPEDGALFRKLGRESELQKLLGYIRDERTPLVVLMGASGAGKTSLLRAGLSDILSPTDVISHYWEALPTDPGEGLLRTLRASWGRTTLNGLDAENPDEAEMFPSTIEELVNPARLGSQNHVIVLDQLEQLRGRDPLECPIFGLLRAIARDAKPPHRITFIVAFRREFRANWSDFIIPEQERGFFPPELSLGAFASGQARDVMGHLVDASGVPVDPKVLDNLLRAIAVDGEVCPVDMGIGLLALSELHRRKVGKTITSSDYHFAGGAEGVLTQYVERCLDGIRSVDRETVLKAMLALQEPNGHQRVAEGSTAEGLAEEAYAEPSRLKLALDHLARPDVRLLEKVGAGGERYRLAHERSISAVLRLSGAWLADVEQARLKFSNAFVAWKNNEQRARFLLDAKDLRLIERCQSRVSWGGGNELEKQDFIRRSMWRRTWSRLGLVAAAFTLVAGAWFANLQVERYEGRRFLKESGYPPELYDWQHQLEALTLNGPLDVERFTWLRSKSLEVLNVKASAYSSSMAGLASLAHCDSLKTLWVDAHHTQISDLKPLAPLESLTQLTLDLASAQVNDLKPLEGLKSLTQLALDLRDGVGVELKSVAHLKSLTDLRLDLGSSREAHAPAAPNDLSAIERLPALTRLALGLRSNRASSLQPLTGLKSLSQLSIDLGGSPVNDLKPLANLTSLTELSLALRDTPLRDLKPLESLTSLTELTLDLRGSQVSSLQPLESLKSLRRLRIDLRDGAVTDLSPLAGLASLTELSLALSRSQVSSLQPLEGLGSLLELSLDLDASAVKDLESLRRLRSLQQLSLDLGLSQVRDLSPLESLPALTRLTLNLRGSAAPDLTALARTKSLRQLSLDLGASQVTDLKPLAELSSLTALSLRLDPSTIEDLSPMDRLTSLTELTLDVGLSKVTDLSPLGRLESLTDLSLRLANSQVSHLGALERLKAIKRLHLELDNQVNDLKPLEGLTSLETLSIANANRAQRMSLRKIARGLKQLVF
ncbi:AAA family ATPase [Pendulispora albinea]|uniref:AAA family ATPase n=1 Tax=Pendulispora albinea TaxID=2741071 RepID=A0ABZ2M1A6_9BACT